MNYILDLDGTLVDSIEDLGNAINYALSELGFPTYSKEEVKAFVGNGAINFVMKSLGNKPDKLEEVYKLFMEYYSKHCIDTVKPYPGVLEFLEENSGRCAILTNKSIDQTLKILKKFDFEKHFTCVLGGDSAPEKKPSPSGIFKIIEDSKWNLSETLMVGDDVPDICAAQAAGIKVAVVLSGFGVAEELLELKPDFVFTNFEEFASACPLHT
ncbi:MAG: HAD-IA family hydrolase [Fibromonadaceae bacterium]|jgi:phosphoglycolate phosphatase|nr:HAD-IA family hydrolase [Fibromonadaceae bacterium]